MKRLTRFLDTPARMAIALGLIVLVSELLIMLLIAGFAIPIHGGAYPGVWDFLDPLMLTVLVLPALYFLIIRPMRNQQELFHMLTGIVASGVMLHRGGKLLYVNPAVERLTGFTREELLGMEYWEVAHPDWREGLRARGTARLRGEKLTSYFEYRVNTKSGVVAWVEGRGAMTEYQGRGPCSAPLLTSPSASSPKRCKRRRSRSCPRSSRAARCRCSSSTTIMS